MYFGGCLCFRGTSEGAALKRWRASDFADLAGEARRRRKMVTTARRERRMAAETTAMVMARSLATWGLLL